MKNLRETIKEILDKYYPLLFVCLIVLISFLCFNNLGKFQVNDWDEARHGVNAYEMFRNKEWIVNTFDYSNDYYNLKPPLSYWCIILSFKIFGLSVFSLRFYSAVSLLLTAVISAVFVKKQYGKIQSLIFLMIFSACSPLYMFHMGRHGDADALYVLLFTAAMIAMMYIPKNKYMIYVCGLLFSINFLDKSWHTLCIAAIGGLFLLFTGEIKKLNIKQWLLFILSSLGPICIWAILRIKKDGIKFLKTMITYDLIDRTNTPLEGHSASILFYFKYLIIHNPLLFIFLFIVVVCSIKYYIDKLKKHDEYTIGLLLWLFVPLILFTIAHTKLAWYIFPVYIPIMILASVSLCDLTHNISNKAISGIIILYFICAVTFYNFKIIRFTQNPTTNPVQKIVSSSLQSNNNLRGRKIYYGVIKDKSKGEISGWWDQSTVFVGEIYNDFNFEYDGIDGFINSDDSNALILLDKAAYEKNNSKLGKYSKIYSDNDYIVLER